LHNKGFSLVEVMVVSGILGALAYFAMSMIENNKRAQKDVENRFMATTLSSEIQTLLKSPENCLKTFENQGLSYQEMRKHQNSNQSSSPIPIGIRAIKKKKNLHAKDTSPKESTFIDAFPLATNSARQKPLEMDKLQLKIREYENLSEGIHQEIDTDALLHFRWDKGSTTRKFPLSLSFDESGKLVSCSSGGTSTETQLTILDPTKEERWQDLSGNEACEKRGLRCLNTFSHNYATRVYGQIGLDNLCQTNYNRELRGVQLGANLSPIHSCDAALGTYETYTLDKKGLQLTCMGIFMAYCY
jgi:prepilin-type N-terminal cleavage/methylation domain-containing protein